MKQFRRRRKYGSRPWTSKEELILKNLLAKGLGADKILPHFKDRDSVSVKSKVQKFKIRYGFYGSADDKDTKVALVKKWIKTRRPKSIFEGFAGTGNLTKIYIDSGANKIYSCELNRSRFLKLVKNVSLSTDQKGKQSKEDNFDFVKFNIGSKKIYLANANAERLASYLYAKNEYFDLVDLDPCGTALPSMYLFLRLVKRGYLAMTYGEFHSYRLGRNDVLLKSIPTAFSFDNNEISLMIKSEPELYKRLMSWTCLQGAFTLEYKGMKLVEPIEHKSLGNRRMYRVLYKISKAKSLAQILNKSISLIKN